MTQMVPGMTTLSATAAPAVTPSATARPLVEVRDLTVKFVSREATVQAVNGVSFEMAPGEVLCIIGESGSGKSVTMRALMRLLPKRRTVISGHMRVGEHDILGLTEREVATRSPRRWCATRAARIATAWRGRWSFCRW
jgi:peptide/nickel transport system ATP-binding protein